MFVRNLDVKTFFEEILWEYVLENFNFMNLSMVNFTLHLSLFSNFIKKNEVLSEEFSGYHTSIKTIDKHFES